MKHTLSILGISIMLILTLSALFGATTNNIDVHASDERGSIGNIATNKPMQTSGYGTIDVIAKQNSTTGSAIPSDWYNISWKFRVRVNVTENAGLTRDAVPITVSLNFEPGQARVGSIMVLDNETQRELPYQLWNVTYYNATYYKSLSVTWIGSLAAYEKKIYYVYWSDTPVTTKATLTLDANHALVYNSTTSSYEVRNRFFTAKMLIGGGITINVDGQSLIDSKSLAPEPLTATPSNATYIWLDSTTMYSSYSGHRDHIRIIPWYDNTIIKVYGYNGTTQQWVKEIEVTADMGNMIRFPSVGESPYNLTKVEASKTVTILVGDLGSVTQGTYGTDGDSDDDFYSYFGTELITWVPRDLFISAYFNNTHVRVIDLSDGDDTFEFTLNDGEVWFHGRGDTRTYTGTSYYYYDYYETSGSPSFFENDIVKIISDKPITVIAGQIANDVWGVIKGLNNRKYVFPYINAFAIGALEDNTNVNVTLKVYNFTTENFDTYYTESRTLNGNETANYNIDPTAYPLVIAIDLRSNVSNSPVQFNVTIEFWNSTSRTWDFYMWYVGTVTPTAEPGVHRNNPNVGNWNETTIYLPGGRYYRIQLQPWGTSDDLDIYLYWKGKNPLYDGDGDDFEFYNSGTGYLYISLPISTGSYVYGREIKHEEWGIAIVESDKPVVVYMAQRYYYYDKTTRVTSSSYYSGEHLQMGTEFNFVMPDYNRWVRIASIYPNTHVRVYLNGTNAALRPSTFYDYGELSVQIIAYADNDSEIIFYQSAAWINVPIPRNTYVKIVSDKPIFVKCSFSWSGNYQWNYRQSGGIWYSYPYPNHYVNYFGFEEISLFVLDVPQYIVNVEPLVEGPIYTKLKISWDIRSNVIVEDFYEFWANSTYFKVSRDIYTPQYVSYEDQFTFLTGLINKNLTIDIQEIWEAPYTTYTVRDYAYGGFLESLQSNKILVLMGSSYGLGLGILNLQAWGTSQFYGGYIGSYYNFFEEATRFTLWASNKVLLGGSYTNRIEFDYIITAGNFGYSTNITTINDFKFETNSPSVVQGNMESTYIDVTIKVTDYDSKGMGSVKVSLSSTAQNYARTLYTSSSGVVVFSKVPASNDYEINIYWTNTSSIYVEFPVADRTFSSITVSSDMLFEYMIKVRDIIFNIHDADGNPFIESNIKIKGIYYYGLPTQSEIIVNSKNFLTNTSALVLKSMPIGRSEYAIGYIKYEFNFTYASVYGITVYNFTSFTWEITNTTNTFEITIPVSTLYVNVLDSNNVSIPGAQAFIYYDSRNYSSLANLTGIAIFEKLPLGTYDVNALFYGTMATQNVTVNLLNETIVNVTLPIAYGVKPASILLSQEYVEQYWGSEVTIYAQLIDSETGETIEGNMTIYIIDPTDNSIILQDLMSKVSGNASEITYYYQFLLSNGLKAGKYYTIKVTGFAAGYAKPSPQNATLYVKPINMVIDYPDRINVYWGRTATIMVNLTHTIEFGSTPISGAQITGTVKREFETIESISLTESPVGSGVYLTIITIDAKYGIDYYSIVLSIGKYGYDNTTISIQLNVLRGPTVATVNTTSVTVIYGEVFSIKATYNRTDSPIEGVSNANATYVILDTSYSRILPTNGYYTLTDLGNGEYALEFNSSNLDLGTYIIRISLGSMYFENRTVDVTLTVKAIPTIAIASKYSETLEWGQNVSITIQYNVSLELLTTGIGDADEYYFNVTMGGNVVFSGNLINIGNGLYGVSFNTSLLPDGEGNYIIEVHLGKAYHQSQVVTIQLIVNSINIDAYPQPANMTLTWGEEGSSQITYVRHRDGAAIKADSYSLTLIDLTQGKPVDATSLTLSYDLVNQYYVLTIDASGLNSSTLYKVVITFTKGHHETVDIEIYITVEPIPTVAIPSSTTVTTFYGEIVNLNVTYQMSNGTLIPGATVTYAIISGSQVIHSGSATMIDTGLYNINFNVTAVGLSEGAYRLTITITKGNYTTQVLTIDLRIQPRTLTLTLFPDAVDAVWGDTVNVTLYVNDYITQSGIEGAVISILGDEEVRKAMTIEDMGQGLYVIVIDTTKINKTQDFVMSVNVSKENYNPNLASFKLKLSKVTLELTIKGASNVQLNPVLGGSTSYKVGVFDKSRNGIPVTEAEIQMSILRGNETMYTVDMVPIEGEPGYYAASINWNNIPGFQPGETYSIKIEFKSITINNVNVPSNMIQTTIATGSVTSTSVDYLGGHAELPGVGRVPVLIFYPVLAIVLIFSSVVGYRVIMYMRLPEEVKEIDRIIKKLEKGIYEYEAVSREDEIIELVREGLS